MGAFIVTLMRGAEDDSLETDLPSVGRLTYTIRRQNVQGDTSFWILTILVRYGVSFSIFLSSHNCNYDTLCVWEPVQAVGYVNSRVTCYISCLNPLKPELNPICYFWHY